MEKSSQNSPSFGQGLELAIIIEKALIGAIKKHNSSAQKVQKLIEKPGTIFKLFEDLLAEEIETKSSILKLISGGEKIMLEALDGQATIADAKKTFKSYISSDFNDLGLNVLGLATPETLVDVYEMIRNANFSQMFNSLNPDLSKLVMTQSQIIDFCETCPTWLRQDGYATLFLIKKDVEKPVIDDNLFVVHVDVRSDGLYVRVYRFENDGVWHAEYRHRLVVPQIIF